MIPGLAKHTEEVPGIPLLTAVLGFYFRLALRDTGVRVFDARKKHLTPSASSPRKKDSSIVPQSRRDTVLNVGLNTRESCKKETRERETERTKKQRRERRRDGEKDRKMEREKRCKGEQQV